MNSIFYINTVLVITSSLFTNVCLAPETTTKNILLWYSRKDIWPPEKYFGNGNEIFVTNNCAYTNCFIHQNHRRRHKSYNASLTFDAIIFNGEHLNGLGPGRMPRHRRPEQIFIFLLLESSSRIPICSRSFDDFFNWTITYRLDSDIPWSYFKVKSASGKTIGPSERVPWLPRSELNNSISTDLKKIVNHKSKIAAWFVSRCRTQSRRENYVASLNVELLKLTRQHVDIYGSCGPKTCHHNETERCNNLLKRDYFFYLAMENSFAKDYVTEKFSKGLRNGAVPIVYGGADYSRFAPPGSYIDARKHTPNKLAAIMVRLIRNRTRYLNYLRWRHHYYYTDSMKIDQHIACQLCAKLNLDNTTKRYKDFRRWWNGNFEGKCASLRKYKWDRFQ